jgi:aspartate racemase
VRSPDGAKRTPGRLLSESRAQGVILGCTEIFLLIGQDDLPGLPVFDTTDLHVEATVAFALADTAPGR